ncbi:protein of unknown function DUF632 [Macleaya cordata]|uniref:DUF632 domain-containing protein n=1 Tax=Macleaya cordata TaxID=56857 RepID=A0A200PNZ3_MACCD|nr:protein of unknown function DUF632 [Macleaya cordata]
MGCTQSKIENEEAVSRCKDRKQFMKDAVTTRNAFAAAHSAYSMALKNTGAALSDYSQGEVHDLRPSHHPVPHPHHPQPNTQPTYETLPPPPPPLPNFSPTPLKRAATMPEFSIPKPDLKHSDTIQEEDDDDIQADENENENADNDLTHRRSRGRGGSNGGRGDGGGATEAAAPPPPPPHTPPNNPIPPPPPESKGMTWDYFFSMDMPPSLSENDEIRPSDNDESDGGAYHNNGFQRSEKLVHENGVGGVGSTSNGNDVEPQTPEKVIEPEAAPKPVKKPKQIIHSNTAPVERRQGKGGMSVSLLQILNDLDDHFLKASESAHEVSKMLEATRLHYHSNFADNRGHIDHSARVMRVITWNRSFRGIPNADDGKDDFDSDEHETHATVLDKLLAWEKKLYDEVKAGELMKLEYQRKVALLNKQKKRSASSESLEKTKAAVSHLHTRYIVDMQSMDSTVSEINRLRDKQLYPKLTALVDGMAQMWHTMHNHHDSQLKIVTDLRSIDVNQTPKETSEQHHERTIQLWGVVQEWHSQFQKLVSHQKEYIQALNNWLKLNLIPIESSLKEKVSSPPRVTQPAIQPLLQAWHEYLEKLPVELAGNAIFSFAGIIKTIKLHQEEEMKLKEKCEETNKEFMKKSRAFDDWYHKHTQKRTPPDEMDPERTDDPNHNDLVAERKFAVESLKKRLEEEVEAYQKHCRQVREKSLGSLKTYLPELFRAMSDFALACSEMYKNLQRISNSQNPTGNPA